MTTNDKSSAQETSTADTRGTDTASPEPFPWSDQDGDGSRYEDDCDDLDPSIYPGALDPCDGLDSDCDGFVEADTDQDGFFNCEECDDTNPTLSPDAPDVLGDGLDTNCDGTDGVAQVSNNVFIGSQLCGQAGWSLDPLDIDQDGTAEIFTGIPSIDPCPNVPIDGVVLLSQTTPLDQTQDVVGPTWAGHHIDAYKTPSGQTRVASVAFNDWPGGTLQVYNVDNGTFTNSGHPELTIRGTGYGWIGGVVAVQEPAQFLAVTATANLSNDMFLSLFDPEVQGKRSIHDAPDLIVSSNEHFSTGQWMKMVGDRDGDGIAELGINATAGVSVADPIGRAYLLTPGLDPVLEEGLETWMGEQYSSITASRVRGGADLDGDGRPEVAVGSSHDNGQRGRVDIAPWLGPGVHYLWTDSLATVLGEFPNDFASDSTLVDADLDGIGDLVVSMAADNYVDSPGKVLLFHGPLSGTLEREDASHVWVGTQLGSRFGFEMVTADVDGSGVPDLIVGAPWQGLRLEGAIHFFYDFGM